jgi:hypothetical protein
MKQPLTTQSLAVWRSEQSEGRVFVVRGATFATVSAAASLSEVCTTLLGSGCAQKSRADIVQGLQTLTRRALSLTLPFGFLPVFFQNCVCYNFQNSVL